jgi:hypothetical protein
VLRTKKATQPLITKKNHATSQDKKITQPLGTTKNHATSWGKNVLKIQILVTIKVQEIGTDHLGLVFITN